MNQQIEKTHTNRIWGTSKDIRIVHVHLNAGQQELLGSALKEMAIRPDSVLVGAGSVLARFHSKSGRLDLTIQCGRLDLTIQFGADAAQIEVCRKQSIHSVPLTFVIITLLMVSGLGSQNFDYAMAAGILAATIPLGIHVVGFLVRRQRQSGPHPFLADLAADLTVQTSQIDADDSELTAYRRPRGI